MKIVHVVIGNSYTDGWAYQENLLPEAHKRIGHEVTVVASTTNSLAPTKRSQTNNSIYDINGVKIIRIAPTKIFFSNKFSKHDTLYGTLCDENPNLIFVHGLNFLSLNQVSKYKKNYSNVIVFADTHADKFNSILRHKFLNKYLIHRGLWKKIISSNIQNIDKVYYTTEGTKEFAKIHYKIDEKKMFYLPMGGDHIPEREEEIAMIRENVRNEYMIKNNELLIISGGRIDQRKELDIVVNTLKDNEFSYRLLIFGKFVDDRVEKKIISMIEKNKRITFIGWLDKKQTIDLMLSADIAIFTGTQSILWRTAVSCGLPLICRFSEGAEELDLNGNTIHVFTDKLWKWKQVINLIFKAPETLKYMNEKAIENGRPFFDGNRIAQLVINDYEEANKVKLKETLRIE